MTDYMSTRNVVNVKLVTHPLEPPVNLTPAQIRTLRTIIANGGEMNGFAGQRGFRTNSLPPLRRRGLIESVPDCANCADADIFDHDHVCYRPLPEGTARMINCCYDRHRITDAGRAAIAEADQPALTVETPAPVAVETEAAGSAALYCRTFSATRRHVVNPCNTEKTLCGQAVSLPEIYRDDRTDQLVTAEPWMIRDLTPCQRCTKAMRTRGLVDAAPAPAPVELVTELPAPPAPLVTGGNIFVEAAALTVAIHAHQAGGWLWDEPSGEDQRAAYDLLIAAGWMYRDGMDGARRVVRLTENTRTWLASLTADDREALWAEYGVRVPADAVTSFTDPPRYPEGTPEYRAYAAELRGELAKWAAGEAPYEY